jgi:hypothetical protein
MKFFKPRDKVIVPVVLFLVLSFGLVTPIYDNLVFSIWPGITGRNSSKYLMSVGPQSGEVAPEIVGTSLEGDVLCLSDYRGKVVFLKFWANSA